ncbi:lamin tail domain-containing protein, partial [Leptodesmis sp.]|uniref:lamin tail domain-containing protein n=1 Tax=Leptodesmis sp. TaxID=3100501 RepID=UPI003D0B0EF4
MRWSDAVQAAAPAQSVSHLVISEFRFRGPLGGNDEFIEIYNPTGNVVDISQWQIKRSNNSGAQSLVVTIPPSTLLHSGQHYLIANTNSSGGYSENVTPDLTYTVGIADTGGIALIDNNGNIVDQAGMTSCSGCYFETTPLTSVSVNSNQSYERKLGGVNDSCQDSDDNSADFVLISPSAPQNLSSSLRLCGAILPTLTPTDTPIPTGTPTPTDTPTSTNVPTNTITPSPTLACVDRPNATPLSILINEVAWAGTAANSADEWIELYNPGSTCIKLDGWVLKSEDNTPTIQLSGVIQANGYYLLERSDDNTVKDIPADKIYSGELSNSGEKLLLYNPNGGVVDTANNDSGGWPAGSSLIYGSMERRGIMLDVPSAWLTNTGAVSDGHGLDADGHEINGTPKARNWAVTVTNTPIRRPTATPTRPPTPVAHIVINEFLPRPGFDWNRDGQVNVYDEFIEIANYGPVAGSISGWQIDDEANLGSAPFALPKVTLNPGDHLVVYASQSNIFLSDGGDTVRLLNSRG